MPYCAYYNCLAKRYKAKAVLARKVDQANQQTFIWQTIESFLNEYTVNVFLFADSFF